MKKKDDMISVSLSIWLRPVMSIIILILRDIFIYWPLIILNVILIIDNKGIQTVYD